MDVFDGDVDVVVYVGDFYYDCCFEFFDFFGMFVVFCCFDDVGIFFFVIVGNYELICGG